MRREERLFEAPGYLSVRVVWRMYQDSEDIDIHITPPKGFKGSVSVSVTKDEVKCYCKPCNNPAYGVLAGLHAGADLSVSLEPGIAKEIAEWLGVPLDTEPLVMA